MENELRVRKNLKILNKIIYYFMLTFFMKIFFLGNEQHERKSDKSTIVRFPILCITCTSRVPWILFTQKIRQHYLTYYIATQFYNLGLCNLFLFVIK